MELGGGDTDLGPEPQFVADGSPFHLADDASHQEGMRGVRVGAGAPVAQSLDVGLDQQ